MKSVPVHLLAFAVAVLVAGTAGYYLGKRSAAAETAVNGLPGRDDGLIGKAARPSRDGVEGTPGADGESGRNIPGGGTDRVGLNGTGGENSTTLRDVLSLSSPLERWQGIMQFALNADDAERATALEDLASTDVLDEMDTAVAALFLYSREGQEDPEAAIAAMMENDDDGGRAFLGGTAIMSTWASADPEAAGAYVLEGEGKDEKMEEFAEEFAEVVAKEWSKENPKAAFQWALLLDDGARDDAIQGVLKGWVAREPRVAAAYALAHAPGKDRKDVYQEVAGYWAKADYRAAMDWAQDLPAEEGSPARVRALSAWAEEDARSAAETFANTEIREGRANAMSAIASALAADAPVEAAAWVLAQPGDDKDREAAIRPVIYKWARSDSMAASEWLATQPPGPVTDQAIASLSRVVVKTDPEGAAIWAMAASDEKTREGLAESIGRQWVKKDPAAAAAWIESSGVSAELKRKLLSEAKKKSG